MLFWLSLMARVFANGLLIMEEPPVVSMYEMLGCWCCLSVFLFAKYPIHASLFIFSSQDWFYLLILSLVCTTIPYIIGVHILKKISPYTFSLTVNLETIYGILFAFFIFRDSETMSATFYIGAGIILTTIFADAILKRYIK